jgi:hypothetical protein
MSWRERHFRHRDETVVPFVQWVNDGGTLEPRSDRGGFAAPVDQGLVIPGTAADLYHKGGTKTPVIFTPELEVAIMATRFSWVKDRIRLDTYQEGARGKLQALGLVRTVDGVEVGMLTFTGLVTREFTEARKRFALDVRRKAEGAPAWAFWMVLEAGDTAMVGKSAKSAITTLTVGREVDPDADYIGEDLADLVERMLDGEAREWEAAWSGTGADGEGEIGPDDDLGAPDVFPSPDAAVAWGVLQGAFPSLSAARVAYEMVRAERQPANARQMARLWAARVREALEA